MLPPPPLFPPSFWIWLEISKGADLETRASSPRIAARFAFKWCFFGHSPLPFYPYKGKFGLELELKLEFDKTCIAIALLRSIFRSHCIGNMVSLDGPTRLGRM
ncbi:uncharacterized protein PV06_03324 [Exophiala oligosperma]|uniref:Uncharacterized protein n=1 Tax=Exophiala oligosperma TaxID=215243 RepID=A0A0D2AYI7_9EURO|nr:uncharacterized protein PV06_03324 [Exophiala oligosperma]KIW44886.1 hypothetical protein PV06_03324 [Exophiala oligosperma]